MKDIHTLDAERRLAVSEDLSKHDAEMILDAANDVLGEDFDNVPQEIKDLISNSSIFSKIADFYTEQALKVYRKRFK